jgi:ABC-2 type transport system ATP-binding protein
MEALRRLDAEGIEVLDVALRRPTLDDVFLTLTGHAAEVEPAADAKAKGKGKGTKSAPAEFEETAAR